MICDTLENLERYESAHPRFKEAFAFLRRLISENAEKGRHDLPGADGKIFANMNAYETKPLSDASKMEVHRDFFDVQIILEGEELMYVPSLVPATEILPYDEGADAAFSAVPPKESCVSFPLPAGSFVIFFPGELHAPGLAVSLPGAVKKLVGKVFSPA